VAASISPPYRSRHPVNHRLMYEASARAGRPGDNQIVYWPGYGPTPPLSDRSWRPPDIERIPQELPRSPAWQAGGVERVLGIGGYFMRTADPAALSAWYRDCLGLDADENGLWRQETGPTVFATFDSETDYFGSRAQQTMLNFRVRDLDAMLAQLRAKGADVAAETQDTEGIGRFGWVTDPEGNRVELWQPA
jgi:predicted enzyme related to lactoylglutathione lyase